MAEFPDPKDRCTFCGGRWFNSEGASRKCDACGKVKHEEPVPAPAYNKNSTTAHDIIKSFRAALGWAPTRRQEGMLQKMSASPEAIAQLDPSARQLMDIEYLCLFCDSVPHEQHWCDGLTGQLKTTLVNNGFLTAEQFDLMTPEALQACLIDHWEKKEHPVDDE